MFPRLAMDYAINDWMTNRVLTSKGCSVFASGISAANIANRIFRQFCVAVTGAVANTYVCDFPVLGAVGHFLDVGKVHRSIIEFVTVNVMNLTPCGTGSNERQCNGSVDKNEIAISECKRVVPISLVVDLGAEDSTCVLSGCLCSPSAGTGDCSVDAANAPFRTRLVSTFVAGNIEPDFLRGFLRGMLRHVESLLVGFVQAAGRFQRRCGTLRSVYMSNYTTGWTNRVAALLEEIGRNI
jgi:hypothetical protein